MSLLRIAKPSKAFLVQVVTSGFLAGSSDFIAQFAIEKRLTWDVARTARFGSVIACTAVPLQYRWFRILEKYISSKGNKFVIGAKKMVLDQVIMAPMITGLFLFNLHVTEGKTVNASVKQIKANFSSIILNNYKVWPAVQMINMIFLPLHYRVVFLQFVGIFWNVYMSLISRK